LGMSVHTGVRTTAIRCGSGGGVTGVIFADGSTLDVDMVVVAAGIRPNIGLAMVSGLETQRGIVVDDQLRSVDDDDIYAVGECVQFSEPSRGVYQTVIIRDGVLVGATLLGDVSKVASLTHAFDRRVPLPEERIRLLFDIGAAPPEAGTAELADESQVCNCNGVSKDQLVACVRDGQRTVEGVMAVTRAGKGCGSCEDLVADIVTAALGEVLQEDPTANYYVPCIPMDKPQLIA